MKLRVPVGQDTLRKDAIAGLVLGVESVPDGLAAGLLAGVNPLAGLYAYLFGTIGGSFFTSSAFMAVQATGAMAIVIADVPAVRSASDPARALSTLSVLTSVVMLAAGFLRLGSVLRFVSNAVMVGFISAVGVNIILGQLPNLTGYKRKGQTASSAPSIPWPIPAGSTCRPPPSGYGGDEDVWSVLQAWPRPRRPGITPGG
jgi:sulfate permease, SulP family